jgi:membrane associated rhomboid family serine protease
MPRTYRPYIGSYAAGYFPPGVKWLLISNTAIFILSAFVPGEILRAWFALSAYAVLKVGFVWQLFTYLFLHGGIMHLVFNMLALWMFGTPLEQTWGTRQFLRFYLYCGLAAGVCVVVVNALLGQWGIPTVGASGAILGLLVGFGVLFPNQTVLMSFLFPIKAKYMVMIYAAIEVWMTFGPNTGVSTVAHLGGMAFGYVYLKSRMPRVNLPDMRYAYRQWKLQRAKKKFQVYMRKHGGGGPWVN